MKTVKQKYSIGTIIETNTGEYIIDDYYKKQYIEQGKSRSRFFYKCHCLNDEYEFERTSNQIDKSIGCPVCSNQKIIYGINSLADKRPDLIQYFVDKELPKKIAPCSNKYADLKCPYCNYTVRGNVGNLYRVGFSCSICSDGVSFPNKYIRAFLNQLSIGYKPEMIFSWAKKYRYDQYLEQYNMIIENDGEQHYKDKSVWRGRNDKEVDKIKEQLAFQNGIKTFIRIDCKISTGKHIRNSIMKSELPTILHFKETDINWEECEKKANTLLTHKIWELWNKGTSACNIMDELNLSKYMVREYINRGYKAGICKEKCYFKKEVWDIHGNNNNHLFSIKPLYCIEDNSYYISASECAKIFFKMGYDHKSISRAAKTGITYKGKHYNYITKNEYNKLKLLSLTNPDVKVYGELLDEKYL